MYSAFVHTLIDSSVTQNIPKEKLIAAFELAKDEQRCVGMLDTEAIEWFNTNHRAPRLEREQAIELRNTESKMAFDAYKATKKASALHDLVSMKKFTDVLKGDTGVWTKYPY
jgi:hypothetical protein